jgi:transcriptional antiterminator
MTNFLRKMLKKENQNYKWKNDYVDELERMYKHGYRIVRDEAKRLRKVAQKIAEEGPSN